MKTILFTLNSVIAVTSVMAGLFMISNPNGNYLGLTPAMLDSTPFKDFLIPGILLVIFVGSINLIAIYTAFSQNTNMYNWAIAGGLVTAAWIIVQMILIQDLHWLQFVFLGVGLLVALIAYQLKGKWAV